MRLRLLNAIKVLLSIYLCLGVNCNVKAVKPITGTWVNLAYKDVRNKYTNPTSFDDTDSNMWKAKVNEMSEMGIEYLILMEVANEGKSYYPSSLMPKAYVGVKSPVDAILEEAEKHGMKVFLSCGWAKDQDDNLRNPKIKKRQLEIMKELASKYKDKTSFFGWYLPVEDCLCPFLADHAVNSVNDLIKEAHKLTPGKKTMISPYGISQSNFDDKRYEQQLSKLKVDIIAYQDEVGCVREKFPLFNLKKHWSKLRDIHNRLNIELWANCETFTWEKDDNDRESALIPANFSRLLSQLVAASDSGIDRIVSFMVPGIIENPISAYQLGQPCWSNEVYSDYMKWLSGDKFWELVEASLHNRIKNNAPANSSVINSTNALIDNNLGEIDSRDSRWCQFCQGDDEIIIDFKTDVEIKNVFFRLLNYHKENINPVENINVSFSKDGGCYELYGVKNPIVFPNNRHDAWIDGILFDNLQVKARYMKIKFLNKANVYMDEIFVNPSIMN